MACVDERCMAWQGNGMGGAWALHGVCELALNVLPRETFREEPTVSKRLWPACSPDLSTCDLYMGGYLKGKVYKSDYRTFK
jgi:hypothetical protein